MGMLKDLKSYAGKHCIEIFELFDDIEMQKQLPPIRSAWNTGRELSALKAENNLSERLKETEMSEIKTVSARLDIEMLVDCPNPDCEELIDLLKEEDTDGTAHDDDGYLLRQMFPSVGDHNDFECDDVTCSKCKATFNVRGLEW